MPTPLPPGRGLKYPRPNDHISCPDPHVVTPLQRQSWRSASLGPTLPGWLAIVVVLDRPNRGPDASPDLPGTQGCQALAMFIADRRSDKLRSRDDHRCVTSSHV